MNVTLSKSGRVVEVLVVEVLVDVEPVPLVEVVVITVVVVTAQVSHRSPVQPQGQRHANPLPERMHPPPLRHGFGSQKFVLHTMPQLLSVPIWTVGGAQIDPQEPHGTQTGFRLLSNPCTHWPGGQRVQRLSSKSMSLSRSWSGRHCRNCGL